MAGVRARQVRSERWLLLESLLHQCPDGAILTYQDIAEHTGVAMNRAGRELLRRVMRKNNREWVCVPGKSIELASVPTSLQIVQRHLRKSAYTIKRTTIAHQNVEHFYEGLPLEDQRQAKMIGIAVGTWVAVAGQIQERLLAQQTHTTLLTKIKENMAKVVDAREEGSAR